jgi:hypothetical protein
VNPFRPDHPVEGIDIEGGLFQVKEFHQHYVDHTDLGAEKKNPGDGAQNAGDDKGNEGHYRKDLLKGGIGPFVDPGHGGAKNERKNTSAKAKKEGILPEEIEFGVKVGLQIVLYRKIGPRFSGGGTPDAVIEEHCQGNEGQIGHDKNTSRQNDKLEVESIFEFKCHSLATSLIGRQQNISFTFS